MRLSSNICCYRNCYKSRLKDNGIAYFRFPIKDKPRTRVWQANCGNIEIALLDINDLKQYKICERHFANSQFIISTKRKVLAQCAVPRRFDQKETEDVIDLPSPADNPPKELKTYSRKTRCEKSEFGYGTLPWSDSNSSPLSYIKTEPQSHINVSGTSATTYVTSAKFDQRGIERGSANVPAPYTPKIKYEVPDFACSSLYQHYSDSLSPSYIKCEPPSPASECDEESISMSATSMLSISETKVNILTSNDETLECKCEVRRQDIPRRKRTKAAVVDSLLKNKSKVLKTFIKMQLLHTRKSKWTIPEMQLAFSIYRGSPKTYSFLLEECKFCLPSVRAIRSWLQVRRLKTGSKTNLTRKSQK